MQFNLLLCWSNKYVCVHADMMMGMGYSRKEIEESLFQQKYNDIMATYLLLARRGSDVSRITSFVLSLDPHNFLECFMYNYGL